MKTDSINQQASVLMKRGIALLETNTPAQLKDAIRCFDEAIALRQTLPLDADPLFRYGLAAGWMNRADALTRLYSSENLTEAVRSYDAALNLLHTLPLDNNPLFRRRLAIAWQNRGLALQMQDEASTAREAERSFEAALYVLQQRNATEIIDRDALLATTQLNYANLLVRQKPMPSILQARTAAQEAIALAEQTSAHDMKMADVNLKARHILCQALTQLLGDINQTTFSRHELVGEATDAAEDGLTLARDWERRGVKQFRSLAEGFFCFGARVYRTFQPHFFDEFLFEHFNPWPASPEPSAR